LKRPEGRKLQQTMPTFITGSFRYERKKKEGRGDAGLGAGQVWGYTQKKRRDLQDTTPLGQRKKPDVSKRKTGKMPSFTFALHEGRQTRIRQASYTKKDVKPPRRRPGKGAPRTGPVKTKKGSLEAKAILRPSKKIPLKKKKPVNWGQVFAQA